MHDANSQAMDWQAAQQRIAELFSQLQARDQELQSQSQELQSQTKLVEEQARTLIDMQQSREQLQQSNTTLQLTIEKLMRQLYGNRRERFLENPKQFKLDFGDDPQAEDLFRSAIEDAQRVVEQIESRRKAKRQPKPRSERLPEHLPRVEKIADVSAEQKQCPTHGARKLIGYDSTETLVLKRPELYVLKTLYPKYACGSSTNCIEAPAIAATSEPNDALDVNASLVEVKPALGEALNDLAVVSNPSPEVSLESEAESASDAVIEVSKIAPADCGIVQAERPTSLVEGNRYDSSIATEVIVQKYGYHLPFYRQQDWFASCGWVPSRSTLLNILVAAEFVLRPLAKFYHQRLLTSGVVGCDETSVTLIIPPAIPEIDPKDPRSKRVHEVFTAAQEKKKSSVVAKMWAYRSVELPINVFDFTVSRHRDGPDEILAEYSGKLLGDCWSGFKKIGLRMDHRIERAACWAHARRKVFDGSKSDPEKASVLLALIRQFYEVEDRGKLLVVAERLQLRQRESVPLLSKIRAFIDSDACGRVLAKSVFGEALTYLRNQWVALSLFTTDGLLPIDNNDVEQLMKQVALGRKNWLFIGSVEAGNRAANLLTIMSTALRNDLDVWAYLKDVLDQLLAGSTDYGSLCADAWKQRHPEHVRVYRADERQEASDRRQYERAQRRVDKAAPAAPHAG